MSKNIRTRIAPSPTGYPHIGTVYQGLFDKAIALKNRGSFILRIEDTDQTRFVEDAEKALYEAFDWFGLTPDESSQHGGEFGPYRQSERLDLYKKYAEELVEKGHAYYCFCSKERLEEVRNDQQKKGQVPMYDKHCRNLSKEVVVSKIALGEKYVIRMKIPDGEIVKVNDLIRGEIEFDSKLIDDQVLIKADGYPTYHLAVVVDDHYMEISHVVRGPEWITSFPKHKLLYDFLSWEMPEFIHTPMITNMDGSKLSKRHGHSSVDWYRRKGYLPEAVINFISLLGWSHPEEKEIFDFTEFVTLFDPKDLSAVNPKFDLVKLEWMNGQYIQSHEIDSLFKKLIDWLKYCGENKFLGGSEFISSWAANDYHTLLEFLNSLEQDKKLLFLEINKERIKKFEDLLPLNNFFIKEIDIDSGLLAKDKSQDEITEHLEWVINQVENISEWNLENVKNIEVKVKERADEIGWKIGEVFYPIRIAICRSKISPPLFESLYILGKEEMLGRLKTAL